MPQRQKFHTDGVTKQYLHNKSGSHGIPLCKFVQSKTQMLLLKKNIFHEIIDCFVVNSSRLHLTFVFCPSLFCKQ